MTPSLLNTIFVLINIQCAYTLIRNVTTGDVMDEKVLCNKNNCIAKCCGPNEMLYTQPTRHPYEVNVPQCTLRSSIPKQFNTVDQLISFGTFKTDIEKKIERSKKSLADFTLVRNDKFDGSMNVRQKIFVLEDGTARYKNKSGNNWTTFPYLEFCVDVFTYENKNATNIKKRYGTRLRLITVASTSTFDSHSPLNIYSAVGYSTSSFFLAVVLVVYALLPQLRNIGVMMQIGYVATLMSTYLLKLIMLVSIAVTNRRNIYCNVLSPMLYFFFQSSNFWLNVMSFDIWWTFRGSRKHRSIHRRGITVKFLWYCLYALASPLAMTTLALVIDSLPEDPNYTKPYFAMCMNNELADTNKTGLYYLYLPGIILSVSNYMFFFLTVYNIWLMRREGRSLKSSNSRTNQKNKNQFVTYVKLSMLMGVYWITLVIQFFNDFGDWAYYVLNFYFFFIGVAIFFMFIWKKKIYLMLKERLGLSNTRLWKMARRLHSRTFTTRSANTNQSSNTTETQLETDTADNLTTCESRL